MAAGQVARGMLEREMQGYAGITDPEPGRGKTKPLARRRVPREDSRRGGGRARPLGESGRPAAAGSGDARAFARSTSGYAAEPRGPPSQRGGNDRSPLLQPEPGPLLVPGQLALQIQTRRVEDARALAVVVR
jgi:hypothetical protein